MRDQLSVGELRGVLALAERVAGCRDLDAFRAAVAAAVHDAFEAGLVVLVERQGQEARTVMYDRHLVSQREFLERHPEVAREQVATMAAPPVPPGTSAREAFTEVQRHTRATIQLSWPAYDIDDAVFVPFTNASGYFGMLAIALNDRAPAVVGRARRFLLASQGFLGATLDNLLHQERLEGQRRALEGLVDDEVPALLVEDGGRVTWSSARARALFVDLLGHEEPPAALTRACVAMLRFGSVAALPPEWLQVGDQALLVRYRQVDLGGRRQVLATLDAPCSWAPEAVTARAQALGLSPREAQVATLVARGLLNKEIAARLAIREQTVKNHLKRAFARTGARSRTELARQLLG